MVLGKLPVPGRPTIRKTVGQGPTALAVGAGGVVWTLLLSSILSLLFLPLFGRLSDIDRNTVSKGRETQNNQPTKMSLLLLSIEYHRKKLIYHMKTLFLKIPLSRKKACLHIGYLTLYSRTSMARTLMARLPWPFPTHS